MHPYRVSSSYSHSLIKKEEGMRKLLYFLTVILMSPMGSAFPQTLSNYVSEVKGDTLVVKDYYEMDLESNSLYWVLTLDTLDVPSGRVYELKASGFYPIDDNLVTQRNTIIYGKNIGTMVKPDDDIAYPPLICGSTYNGSQNTGSIIVKHDLTISNCNIVPVNENGDLGQSFLFVDTENVNVIIDNCLFEHTGDVFITTYQPDCNITLRNCYFVNMNGRPGRHNGGVFESYTHQGTLLVENCTHIMAQGDLYRFGGSLPFYRIIFNHNTFVNCAGNVFLNTGFQRKMALINNLFVNSNILPYSPLDTSQSGEQDPDRLPIGLVNISHTAKVPLRFIVDKNLGYWDPSFDNIDGILNANAVNGLTDWQSQRIWMNARTQDMFNNNYVYPGLMEGSWYEELPGFINPQNLLTTFVDTLKEYALKAVDANASVILPVWRLVNQDQDYFLYSDWPIPVDLSYDDPELLTGAYGGFPVGDLNWFSFEKESWSNYRDSEYFIIYEFLEYDSVGVTIKNHLPQEFSLNQNYPNPFNPSTTISFSIPKACRVSLKVYDIRGREVAALLDDFVAAKTYDLRFDGTDFPSGVYTCTLQYDDVSVSKKMLLMK